MKTRTIGQCKDTTHYEETFQIIQPSFYAEVIQVIYTNLELRGDGTEGNPYRRIEQYWNLDGTLLFEKDEWKGKK